MPEEEKDDKALEENLDFEGAISDDVSDVDYDSEIAKLLKEDAETELVDLDYNYINDISVYDPTIEQTREESEEEEKKEEAEEKSIEVAEAEEESYLIFYIVIGVLIFAVICVSALLFTAVLGYDSARGKAAKGLKVEVSQPIYKSNNVNYIYLSKKVQFDEMDFEVSKMLVDSTATLFYINKNIDLQKYNIILTDNNNNMYNMDLSFVQAMKAEDKDNETVLHFEPLDLKAKSIMLTFYNSATSERVSIGFDFTEPLVMTPVKYVYNQNVLREGSLLDISVDKAVFSSAGSHIDYFIKCNAENYSVSAGENKSCVTLEEGSTPIKETKNYASTYSFDDGKTILGRMDFDSIRNLNNKVYITFDNLFKKYTKGIPSEIPMSAIKDGGYVFDIDNYRVFIEGLGISGDKCVIVLHAENKNIKVDNDKSRENRVEVQLDADVLLTASNGMSIELNDAVTNSASYGTDMVFNISNMERGFIQSAGGNVNNMSIILKSVLIRMDGATLDIDLSKYNEGEDAAREKAENDVIDAFKGRLACKSGTKTFTSLSGFSEELLKSSAFLADYTEEETTEMPVYSAQVIASAFIDNKYYALVEEVWKGINGVKETHFYRTHKVEAEKGEFNYKVVKDDVIK